MTHLLDGTEDDALASTGHVGEKAMFDRIVLGGVRRIVSNSNFQAHVVGQRLQVLFEDQLRGAVATAAIAKQQQRPRIWMCLLSLGSPPLPDAIAGKFARVVAAAEIDVAAVALEIVQAVRDDVAVGE